MKTLILSKLFSGKNKYALLIYIVIVLGVFIIILPHDSESYELILYTDYYNQLYNDLLLELLKVLIPLGVLIITLEHDQQYLRNLSPTIGRSKILTSKILSYTIIIIFFTIFIFAYYLIILNSLGYMILYGNEFYLNIIYLLFDLIIIFLFILLLTRTDKKILAFIILITYYLTNYIYEIIPNIFMYYILPFHTIHFANYIYATFYKIIYLLILIIINYISSSHEQYY